MKIKYNFLSPLLMAILTICCLWIVTDVAYGVRMWELGVDAWIGRIKALAIILIGVSLSYLFRAQYRLIYRDLFYKWNDLSVGRGVNDQCGSCADLSPILFLDP